MITTFILSIIMMAGLFLLLWSAVALIQDKKFFTSAPKEAQAVIQPKEERFPGAHALGYALGIFAILLMGGAVIYGCWDGIRSNYSFWQFFVRFLIMLWGLKLFDILFFDYYLLCRSKFFSHYYPEVADLYGPHLFGYNRKQHLVHIIVCLFLAALIAWICTLL
ncbi:MAG: hypothetical protein IJ192_03895 [Clostridia bacterium]|nr:hypothetical protein [Clostridia bacterium]MBR2175431.1 hypothetical protein [Clostridia bacterium]